MQQQRLPRGRTPLKAPASHACNASLRKRLCARSALYPEIPVPPAVFLYPHKKKPQRLPRPSESHTSASAIRRTIIPTRGTPVGTLPYMLSACLTKRCYGDRKVTRTTAPRSLSSRFNARNLPILTCPHYEERDGFERSEIRCPVEKSDTEPEHHVQSADLAHSDRHAVRSHHPRPGEKSTSEESNSGSLCNSASPARAEHDHAFGAAWCRSRSGRRCADARMIVRNRIRHRTDFNPGYEQRTCVRVETSVSTHSIRPHSEWSS